MDTEFLKIAGQVAGIGGLTVGALVIIFRNIIRKNIFPSLTKEQAYSLLRLIVVLVWTVAIAGIAAWTYASANQKSFTPDTERAPIAQQTSGTKLPEEIPDAVYVTRTGEKYHRSGCQYLTSTNRPISRPDAIAQGYTACKGCTP